MAFTISFFELAFLAEVCIPPVPIARHSFFMNLIDRYYNQLQDEERTHLFEWITKKNTFNRSDETCELFYCRYNPDNQYTITLKSGAVISCFKKEESYWVSSNQKMNEDFIVAIDKI